MRKRSMLVAGLAAALVMGVALPASAIPPPPGPDDPDPMACLLDTVATLNWSAGATAFGPPVLIGQSVTVSWDIDKPTGCLGVAGRISGPGFNQTQNVATSGSQAVTLENLGLERWTLRLFYAGQQAEGATTTATVHPLPSFTPVAAAEDSAGTLSVIRARADGTVLRDEKAGPFGRFHGWRIEPGKLQSVAAESDGLVAIEAGLDPLGGIWTSHQANPGSVRWSDWRQIDGRLMTIALARNANGSLEMLGTDVNGVVWRRTQSLQGDGTFGSPSRMTGPPMQTVAAEAEDDGRITMVGVGLDGTAFVRSQRAVNGTDWTDWTPLPAMQLTAIAIAKAGDRNLRVYGIDRGGQLRILSETDPGASTWFPTWLTSADGHVGPVAAQYDLNGFVYVFGNDRASVPSFRTGFGDSFGAWRPLNQYAPSLGGPKLKLLVMKVEWAGALHGPNSRPIGDVMQMANNDHWWPEVSYGRLGDFEVSSVLQTIALPRRPGSPNCSDAFWPEITSLADPIAAARNRDPVFYDKVLYYLPPLNPCVNDRGRPVAGATDAVGGKRMYIVSNQTDKHFDTQTIIHEMGHALGLDHAQALDCRDGAGRPVTLSTDCSPADAGDPSSAMGARNLGGFAAQQRNLLNWQPGIANVSAAGGTYVLSPIELTTIEPNRSTTQALRITDGGTTLWVEQRQQVGVDANEVGLPGVYVYREDPSDPRKTFLLDMTPGTHPEDPAHPSGLDHADANLASGRTWVNPLGHLKITVTFENSTGAGITVQQS